MLRLAAACLPRTVRVPAASAPLRSAIAARPLPALSTVSVTNWQQHWYSTKIIYTQTDEAPALATYSLLPIIKRFTDPAGIAVETSDISLAGRILSHFPENLTPEQRVPDNLAALGELATSRDANIIKLPNVSASIPQLIEAVTELQAQGYNIPSFTQPPTTEAEKQAADRYAKVLGSAVNPVLREGNSDRRVAPPVKRYAQAHPHKLGEWSKDCRTHVAYMSEGDFYGSEQSYTMPTAGSISIEHTSTDGTKTVLKKSLDLQFGEVIDASFLSKRALYAYLEKEIADARNNNILLSLHLKATMMKISDPILFGHVVRVYFKDVFAKHDATFQKLGVNPRNGFGDVLEKIAKLPADKRAEIEADIEATYAAGPRLAMVDSGKGITNLHVPSDVIIDASMPCVVRDSGKMWNKDGVLEDTKCLIPDRSYATFYDEALNYCREHGQFDVATMGNVANVGLMAQKAEEYGSHDKTFEIAADGIIQVVDNFGKTIFKQNVEQGDIWRMCQAKDAPIKDWVALAVRRARTTGSATIFWLDEARAHDRSLIAKVEKYLPEHDTTGLDISIMPPQKAVVATMERATAGLDTISVTGNVLRDYLTDLFPIIELGTSAKMLSIVPLLAGGALFETGAGGSAPKHVQQFQKEGHLRWDSLGEYLALGASLEHLGNQCNNERALLLGETLNEAIGNVLDNRKSPSRKVKEIDNRGTNFYLALYWAEAMVARGENAFAALAKQLEANEASIVDDLIKCQGKPVDLGGYYHPDPAKIEVAMRPSKTFNDILEAK